MTSEDSKPISDYIVDLLVFLGKRSIVLYVLTFMIFHSIVDYDRAKLLRLNRMIPSFEELMEFAHTPDKYEEKALKKYVNYYETVTEYMSSRADAYAMLGFCYFYSSDVKRSIDAYQKAIELNPRVFWFHYNLGIIYFKEKRFADAVQSFKKALETKPQNALVFLKISKIYQDLLRVEAIENEELERRLKKEYQNCHKLLMLSSHFSKSAKSKEAPMAGQFHLKIY